MCVPYSGKFSWGPKVKHVKINPIEGVWPTWTWREEELL